MRLIDWIFGILLPIAVVLTVFLYLGTRGPTSEVRSVTIHEIPAPHDGHMIPAPSDGRI